MIGVGREQDENDVAGQRPFAGTEDLGANCKGLTLGGDAGEWRLAVGIAGICRQGYIVA